MESSFETVMDQARNGQLVLTEKVEAIIDVWDPLQKVYFFHAYIYNNDQPTAEMWCRLGHLLLTVGIGVLAEVAFLRAMSMDNDCYPARAALYQ